MARGAGLADIDPMAIDQSVSCDKVIYKTFSDQCTVDSSSDSLVSSFVSSGGVRQHRRSVRSHFSAERNGRLPAPLPRSV